MNVHPTKNVSIGIDPYPYNLYMTWNIPYLCLSVQFHWVPRALSGVQTLSTELFTVHLGATAVKQKMYKYMSSSCICVIYICNMCTYFVSLCFKTQFNNIHHIFLFVLWTVSFKTIHLGCKPSFNEIIKIDCCTRNDEPHKTTCKNTVQDKCCNPCSANFMSLSRPSKVMSPYPRHVFFSSTFLYFSQLQINWQHSTNHSMSWATWSLKHIGQQNTSLLDAWQFYKSWS